MKRDHPLTTGFFFGLGFVIAATLVGSTIAAFATSKYAALVKEQQDAVPYDSTDDGTKRSGLVVHRDAKTGINYLSNPKGGLTVRLAADGSIYKD